MDEQRPRRRRMADGAEGRPQGGAAVGKPRDRDVLFGRGRAFINRGGNKALHSLANEYRPLYKAFGNRVAGIVERKQQHGVGTKQEIVDKIVATLQDTGARFLKRDDASQRWFEVDISEARAKVSHLLRSKQDGDASDDHASAQPTREESVPQAALDRAQVPLGASAFHQRQLAIAQNPHLLFGPTQIPTNTLYTANSAASLDHYSRLGIPLEANYDSLSGHASGVPDHLNTINTTIGHPNPLFPPVLPYGIAEVPRLPTATPLNPVLAAMRERIRRLHELDRLRNNDSSTSDPNNGPPKQKPG